MGNCLRNRRAALDSVLMGDESSPVAIGQNQPLDSFPEPWTAQVPMTEGQLRGRRVAFWETAPAYDGRKEIWDALKAACEAVEDEDHGLAQAILDGANISLPTGRLVEAYDELGNRYVVPKYCISRPSNMLGANSSTQEPAVSPENEDSHETDSTTNLLQDTSPSPAAIGHNTGSVAAGSGLRNRSSSTASGKVKRTKARSKSGRHSGPPSPAADVVPMGDPIVVKVRLSTLPKDIKMTLQASDRVRDVKRRLEVEQGVQARHITMLYSGRVLNDRTYLKNLHIPRGFLIQAVVT